MLVPPPTGMPLFDVIVPVRIRVIRDPCSTRGVLPRPHSAPDIQESGASTVPSPGAAAVT